MMIDMKEFHMMLSHIEKKSDELNVFKQRINIPISKINTSVIHMGTQNGCPYMWFLAENVESREVRIHSYMTGDICRDRGSVTIKKGEKNSDEISWRKTSIDSFIEKGQRSVAYKIVWRESCRI